jgi:hypothetical protein
VYQNVSSACFREYDNTNSTAVSANLFNLSSLKTSQYTITANNTCPIGYHIQSFMDSITTLSATDYHCPQSSSTCVNASYSTLTGGYQRAYVTFSYEFTVYSNRPDWPTPPSSSNAATARFAVSAVWCVAMLLMAVVAYNMLGW